MATNVYELNISHVIDATGLLPVYWTLNINSNDASTARVIKAAEAGKRHWIESVVITGLTSGTNWIKIMDGNNEFIGPVIPANGVPLVLRFNKAVHGTANTDLNIKSQADFNIHMIVEGYTDP